MIHLYSRTPQGLRATAADLLQGIPSELIWIDLLRPSLDEEHLIEQALRLDIPTREELQEIEVSSRLFTEGNASYMTANLICHADTDHPQTTPVTFVLSENRLITIRYEEPRPFTTFPQQAERHAEFCVSAQDLLLGFLDAVIDRSADVLERAQAEVDSVASELFAAQKKGASRPKESGTRYREMLRRAGRCQLLTLKLRESLVSIGRVLTFLGRPGETKQAKSVGALLKTLNRDVSALTDHASHLAQTITFLQEATLGLINIEQNEIIKMFSIVAVVFLPPTLIASIYGMNFNIMPELKWGLGYPLALLLMLASALTPYLYFKRRGWF